MRKRLVLVAALAAASVGFAETYSENATVAGDEPLVIAAGEKLEFDVAAGATVTVTRVISGEGILLKKGLGRLNLDAANVYSGGTEIWQGEIFADCEGALGTGTVTFTGDNSFSLAFNAPDGTFYNDIVFNQDGAYMSTYRTPVIFDQNTTFKGNITGPSSGTVYIGIIQITDAQPTKHQHVVIDGDVDFSKCTLGIRTYGVLTFNGRVQAKSLTMSNTFSGVGHLVFNHPDNNLGSGNTVQSYCPYIVCGAPNAVSNFSWIAQYNYGSTTGNCMDLGGYDQTMVGVKCNPVGDPGYKPPAAPGDSAALSFFSGDPATLTFTGHGANQTNIQFHAFGGALSFTLDAAPTYTLEISNRTHRMSGELCVSNGTLRAVNQSSFPSAKKVTVARGAALEIVDAATDAFASCRALAVDGRMVLDCVGKSQMMSHPSVALGADAEFALPADVKLQVSALTVDGEALPEGRYAAGDERVPQLVSGTLWVSDQAWPEAVEPVYTFTVDENLTNRIDDLDVGVTQDGVTTTVKFSAIADPTSGTVVKTGKGVLFSSKRLSTFTGQILVEEGGFAIDDNNETGPQNKATAPIIWVRRGASFILYGTSDTCGSSNLKLNNAFHLAGEGLNGLGAIDNELNAYQNYAFNGSNPWYLDGDTLVSGYGTSRFDAGNMTLNMQGNRLRMTMPPGVSPDNWVWTSVTVASAGEIVAERYNFTPQGTCYWQSGEVSTISITNGATFGYYNTNHKGTERTTLKFCTGNWNNWSVGGSDKPESVMHPGNVNQGFWDGPIQIDGSVHVYGSSPDKGAAFRGKVSGAGELLLSSGWFHFYSSENDFTAPVTMRITTTSSYKPYRQGIAAYANGALPLSCPRVSITNGACALLDAARFDLPPVEFYATEGTNLEFYCANAAPQTGTLAGLRKDGPGSVTYRVPLAVTGVVEAVEGVVDTDGKALTVGTLAIAGGTIRGDVTVTDAVTCRPDALQDRSFAVLTVDGKLTFAPGAMLDLDALVASGVKVRRSGRLTTVIRATGGIEGAPTVAAGGATDAACWSCVVDGDELKLIRSVGTMILLR